MNTLHTVRKFALVAALATGALIASASQADESRTSGERVVANLGHMTVVARRPAEFAHLGSMVVTASRIADTRVADLGSITVSAPRLADTQVADLGGMTVTARRIATVVADASKSSVHSWQ